MGHKSLLGEKRMRYDPFDAVVAGTKQVKNRPETIGERPKQMGKEYVAMTGFPTSILKYKNETGLHPTQKPVPLLEFLIKTYTAEGDLVLDNCCGSGSTLVAAVNTNRHYIGFEIDPKYFDIANRRIFAARWQVGLEEIQ